MRDGGSKAEAARVIEQTGASLLFLPTYSPGLSPLEHNCAALTKNREYSEKAAIDEIV
ncbi:MAG: hypothetical protein AB7P69_19590 [Candidatus Binatia bacterium]